MLNQEIYSKFSCSEKMPYKPRIVNSGAYEGFCLVGAQFARVSAPKKNIDTFFIFFAPPPTWTCFVHHKNKPKRLHFWVVNNLIESKNYSFA